MILRSARSWILRLIVLMSVVLAGCRRSPYRVSPTKEGTFFDTLIVCYRGTERHYP
jgi:hypothetical protein